MCTLENYKTLLREIIEGLKIEGSWAMFMVKTLNIIKISVLLKLIYRPNTIPVCFLIEIVKLTQKLTWKCKGTRGAKITLKKNKIVRLLYFKINYTSSKLKRVILQKTLPKEWKDPTTDLEKIVAKHSSDKRLVSRIKNYQNSIKRQTTQ